MYVRCWDIPPGPAGFWAPPVPPVAPLLPPPPPPLLLLPLLPAEPDWRSENATNDSIVIKILREALTEKTDEPRAMLSRWLHSSPFLLSSFFGDTPSSVEVAPKLTSLQIVFQAPKCRGLTTTLILILALVDPFIP